MRTASAALAAAVLATGLSAGTALAAEGLHDCDTRVEGNSGTGWCHGTGSFQLALRCVDGTEQFSGIVYIQQGYGLVSTSCFGKALSARILMRS
ncbi:hypothetical protein GCM10010174_63240 [Kutzneria viridogrisea]|uniref:Uncharacterized protein n=1 Tax=Kutzneria viridogrisea TaxID=47990 RepID=A0ABR6BFW0_9PSEU|nr:hypothetical protein [Kutzneria viridogrisea]